MTHITGDRPWPEPRATTPNATRFATAKAAARTATHFAWHTLPGLLLVITLELIILAAIASHFVLWSPP